MYSLDLGPDAGEAKDFAIEEESLEASVVRGNWTGKPSDNAGADQLAPNTMSLVFTSCEQINSVYISIWRTIQLEDKQRSIALLPFCRDQWDKNDETSDELY